MRLLHGLIAKLDLKFSFATASEYEKQPGQGNRINQICVCQCSGGVCYHCNGLNMSHVTPPVGA